MFNRKGLDSVWLDHFNHVIHHSYQIVFGILCLGYIRITYFCQEENPNKEFFGNILKNQEKPKGFAKRLKEARRKTDKTQSQLAELLGVTQPTINRWETGGAEPSLNTLVKLAKFYNISTDWLLTGQDSPREKAAVPPDITFSPLRSIEAKKQPTLLRFQDIRKNYTAIPLLKDAIGSRPPAGVNENDVESWVIIFNDPQWLPGGPENYTCVRVQGKSMYPILDEGDIVAIDHSERPKDLEHLKQLHNKIAAFRDNGGVTLNWLKYNEAQDIVVGIPENKEDPGNVIVLEGREKIVEGILGLVRWWWSKR